MQDGFAIRFTSNAGINDIIELLEQNSLGSRWVGRSLMYGNYFINLQDSDFFQEPYYYDWMVSTLDIKKNPVTDKVLYEQFELAKKLLAVFKTIAVEIKRVALFFDLPDGSDPNLHLSY